MYQLLPEVLRHTGSKLYQSFYFKRQRQNLGHAWSKAVPNPLSEQTHTQVSVQLLTPLGLRASSGRNRTWGTPDQSCTKPSVWTDRERQTQRSLYSFDQSPPLGFQACPSTYVCDFTHFSQKEIGGVTVASLCLYYKKLFFFGNSSHNIAFFALAVWQVAPSCWNHNSHWLISCNSGLKKLWILSWYLSPFTVSFSIIKKKMWTNDFVCHNSMPHIEDSTRWCTIRGFSEAHTWQLCLLMNPFKWKWALSSEKLGLH